jgi:hypothetical protein
VLTALALWGSADVSWETRQGRSARYVVNGSLGCSKAGRSPKLPYWRRFCSGQSRVIHTKSLQVAVSTYCIDF